MPQRDETRKFESNRPMINYCIHILESISLAIYFLSCFVNACQTNHARVTHSVTRARRKWLWSQGHHILGDPGADSWFMRKSKRPTLQKRKRSPWVSSLNRPVPKPILFAFDVGRTPSWHGFESRFFKFFVVNGWVWGSWRITGKSLGSRLAWAFALVLCGGGKTWYKW